LSTHAELLRQVGLVLLGWTALSVLAVGPIVWWMRRRAALNDADLPLLADRPASISSTDPRAIAGGLQRS
jgi:hypothetical protein